MMRLAPDDQEAIRSAAAVKRCQPLLLPSRLSPTAVSTFRECPQLFLFRNLWKLPEPPSKVLVKGSLVHAALEKVFELPPKQRRASLHDVLRNEWRVERKRPRNAALFTSRDEERTWGLECLHLLDNYLAAEDPAALPHGEPLAHEAWLKAELPGAAGQSSALTMVGKVDRLDLLDGPLLGVTIVDYKTGKAPSGKYSPAMNAEIRRKNFFQLRCYALLLCRGDPPRNLRDSTHLLKTRRLRLLYLGDGVDGGATAVEEDLPGDDAAYEAELDATQGEILGVWRQIVELVENGDPAAFGHCTRPFCFCHDARPIVFPDQALFS